MAKRRRSKVKTFLRPLWGSRLSAVAFVVIFAGIASYLVYRSFALGAAPRIGHPEDTGGAVCSGYGNSSELTSPYSSQPAPLKGATVTVSVPAGNNSNFDWDPTAPNRQADPVSGRTYWFASGVHTLGSSLGNQIIPANNDSFIGAPGAIIDGQNINAFAFTQHASNVTIEYLTIKNFIAPQDQFIVNHDSGSDWTISHNTIGPNRKGGAGLGLGQNQVVSYNCITQNGQYGINGYNAATGGGPTKNVVISHNQIDTNDVYTFAGGCQSCGYDNYPKPSLDISQCPYPQDCGVSGGAKLWNDVDLTFESNVVTNNHHTGIWADTSNQNIVFNKNYFAFNWGIAIWYEVSYNPTITNNTMVDNAIVDGARDTSKLDGAIYFSESGYDKRVDNGKGGPKSDVSNNIFQNNWSGIALWENSNRYCSNGLPTTNCTLVSPAATVISCAKTQPNGLEAPSPVATIPNGSSTWDCRWRTQNVYVHDNRFHLNPDSVNSFLTRLATSGDAAAPSYPVSSNLCTPSNGCGFNSTVSEWGSSSFWPKDLLPNAITFDQNLMFDYNKYQGPWHFDVHELGGTALSFAQWQAGGGKSDPAAGLHSGDNINHPAQDVHSTATDCVTQCMGI